MNWSAPIAAYLKLDAATQTSAGALLQTLGNACQNAIERSIARTFAVVDYTETYTGNGRAALFLRHDPVTAVSSVIVDGSALTFGVPAGTYPLPQVILDSTGSGLVRTDGAGWCSTVAGIYVAYSAGLSGAPDFVTPPDLVEAVVYWAAMLWKDAERIGMATKTVAQAVTGYTRVVPPIVALMISQYRRVLLPSSC